MNTTPGNEVARRSRGLRASPLHAKTLGVLAALLLLAAIGDGALAHLPAWRGVAPPDADARAADVPSPPADGGADSDAAGAPHVDTDLDADAPAPHVAARIGATFDGDDAGARIDLNAATLEELTTLPRVGPKRARAILELRARLGGFRRVEDLLRVRGLGRATLAKIRPLATVGPRDASEASGGP